MSTIVCSCGAEFHRQASRNTYYSFKSHLESNPSHYEVLRFSFHDPRKIEHLKVSATLSIEDSKFNRYKDIKFAEEAKA